MRFPRPVDLINGRAGRVGLTVTRGIVYGPDPRQKLDFYRPARGPARLPMIVFFYGGSWQFGERRDYGFVAARLARLGFAVAVPDYRLYPQARFPAFVQDGALAAAWCAAQGAALGGDPAALFLAGHSAGAYIAVMLGLVPAYLGAAGLETDRVAGVIGLAGPYDFLPLGGPAMQRIFANDGDLAATQPVNFAHAEAPPMLLLTGAKDRTVLPRNSTALAARLRALGAVVETRVYPALGHVGIVTSLLRLFAWRAPVRRDIAGFIVAALAGDFARVSSDTSERIS